MDNTSLIWRIRNAPHRYLRQRTLSWLQSFLDGVSLGCADGAFADPLYNEFSGFHEWFSNKYAAFPKLKDVNAWRVIQLLASDDWNAFDIFYAEFQEFVSEQTPREADVEAGGCKQSDYCPQFEGMGSLLTAIRKRPAMYIHSLSVSRFRAFLDGYEWGFVINGLQPNDQVDLKAFARWLGTTLSIPEYEEWDRILLFMQPDESQAFSEFWRLLDMFEVRSE